jgi:hypothetical protein
VSLARERSENLSKLVARILAFTWYTCVTEQGVQTASPERITVLTKNQVAEYREVADFLDEALGQGVDLPLPAHIVGNRLQFTFSGYQLDGWYLMSEDERSKAVVAWFRRVARGLGGKWSKNDPKSSTYDDQNYQFTSESKTFGDGSTVLVLSMDRDMICERVQVGTEKKVIPAVEAKPETVIDAPVFERECKPLFENQEKELDEAMKSLESGDVVEGEVVSA